MKYDAVIFDLDGVICYTDEYHYQAWKAMADELGAYFDREINNRLRGVSRMASLDIVLETYDGELSQAEKEDMQDGMIKAVGAVEKMIAGDVDGAMSEYNRKEGREPSSDRLRGHLPPEGEGKKRP